MKQFLLSALVILSCLGFAARAEELPSMAFGYCGEYKTPLGITKNKTYIGGCVEVTPELVSDLKGNEMTKVRLAMGPTRFATITFFIAKTLGGEPVYTQQVNLVSEQWNTFDLDVAWPITGESFVMGFYMRTTSDKDYPCVFDGRTTETAPGQGYMAYSYANEEEMMEKFEDMTAKYGNLCIQGIVQGDNLPENLAQVSDVITRDWITLDTPFNVDVVCHNTGSNHINSIELALTVGEEETKLYQFDNMDIDFNGYQTLEIADVTTKTSAYALPVHVQITKVNGQDAKEEASNFTTIMSSNDLLQRVVVVEEGTATWCSYCPRGYWGMETMREQYGKSGNYIGIAVHQTDEMAISAYKPWLTTYAAQGIPSAMASRMISINPSPANIEKAYKQVLEIPVEAKLTIDAEYVNDDMENAKVNVNSNFVFDIEDANYGIALVLVEDNVGPYIQTNGYANNSNGFCGGFETMGGSVPLMYNEVATYVNAWNGAIASVPTSIKAFEDNLYSARIPLKSISKLDNAKIVALLINRESGYIINAAELPFIELAGVNNINEEGFDVVAANGKITISGEFTSAVLYDVNGMRIAEVSDNAELNVGHGAYIMTVSTAKGNVTKKIIL